MLAVTNNFRAIYDDLNDVKKRLVREKFCRDFEVSENTFLNRISDLNPSITDYKYFATVFDFENAHLLPGETKAIPLATLVEEKRILSTRESLKKNLKLVKPTA